MQALPVGDAGRGPGDVSAKELIERCSARNCEDSWTEFLNRFGWALSSAIRRALSGVAPTLPQDLHDDLVQETWCRLLGDRRRRLRNCRGADDRAVAGYLSRVAENVVTDYLRRSMAAKRGQNVTQGPARSETVGPVDSAPDPRPGADRDFMVAESRRLFFTEAGKVLEGRHRLRNLWVVYLAVFEGWTSREISERLKTMTPTNVDSVVHRCRRRLGAAGIQLPRLRDGVE